MGKNVISGLSLSLLLITLSCVNTKAPRALSE